MSMKIKHVTPTLLKNCHTMHESFNFHKRTILMENYKICIIICNKVLSILFVVFDHFDRPR